MSGFEESIVREYFEMHGFLVQRRRRYVQSRKRLASEEVELRVHNLNYRKSDREPNFLLFASELPRVEKALVSVKSWHGTDRINPKMIRSSGEVQKFLEKHIVKSKEELFSADGKSSRPEQILKVLILPALPTAEPFRGDCIALLKKERIDGVISFRTILLDVIQKIELNKYYQKSDFLEILRVLKNYDLVKEPQLGLFED